MKEKKLAETKQKLAENLNILLSYTTIETRAEQEVVWDRTKQLELRETRESL